MYREKQDRFVRHVTQTTACYNELGIKILTHHRVFSVSKWYQNSSQKENNIYDFTEKGRLQNTRFGEKTLRKLMFMYF